MFRTFASKLQIPRLQYIQKSKFATDNVMPPYTPEELSEKRRIFRTMPTYDPKDETIKTSDYPRLAKAIRYEMTQEQLNKNIAFHDKLGGKVNMGEFMQYLPTVHNPKLMILELVATVDKDNNGFISKEEYDYLVEILKNIYPDVKMSEYKKFVEEADTNKDGKVSLDELREWLRK